AEMIAAHGVAGTDDEDTTEERAVERVIHNPDIARLHVRIAVIHNDAEVAVWVGGEFHVLIEAGVPTHFAVMEAVEIEAFAVDFFELGIAVDRFIHVARGVYGYREGLAFQIDLLRRIADGASAIVLHTDFGGMAHLNGIARD